MSPERRIISSGIPWEATHGTEPQISALCNNYLSYGRVKNISST
jgi:hypothetical protein